MKPVLPALKKRGPPAGPATSIRRSGSSTPAVLANPPSPQAADSAALDDLWVKFKASGDPILRNRLIEAYYPDVRYISKRLLGTLPRSIELDDLTSAGLFGLMDAINHFDLSRGIKFKTYCAMRIRGSILDELRNQDWVPRLVRIQANRIARAWKATGARLGREPSDEEMAAELKIPTTRYLEMREEAKAASMFSLSDKLDDSREEGALEHADCLADHSVPSPIDALQRRDAIEVLTQHLAPKEKRVIIMYYYEGLNMKQIGRILDLTESRVCQIHGNIMVRLREQIGRMNGLSA
jgi:RNA polymerase sigma factor for flagellar operon FliA